MNLIFELDYLSISNWIFIAWVACKNPVQNRQKIKFKHQFQKSISWPRDFKNQVKGKFYEIQILLTKIVKKVRSFLKSEFQLQGLMISSWDSFPNLAFTNSDFFFHFFFAMFLASSIEIDGYFGISYIYDFQILVHFKDIKTSSR